MSQSDTWELALANIRQAIDLYVEDCRAEGDPVPQEDSLEYVELETRAESSFPIIEGSDPERLARFYTKPVCRRSRSKAIL